MNVFKKIKEKLEEQAMQAEKDMGLSDTFADASECGGKWEAYTKAISVVQEVAEEYNNGWISINPDEEDTFPKDDNYILLSFSNFSIPLIGRYKEDEEGGAFYIGDEDETCVSQDLFVNAWMPLPEPYKEKE